MANVTPTFALIVFIVILIISAALSLHFSNFSHFHDGRLHSFVAILAGLGVFVTFMFYYSVVSLQQQQQRLFVIQETSRLSTTLSNSLLTEFNSAANLIPNFVFSLMPLNNCEEMPPDDPETPMACTEKYVLSHKVFSVWQDLIIANTFVEYDPIAYVTSFLQYANSSQLFAQWGYQKINFNIKTQEFGDLLFEYGIPITEQTPENYVIAAEKLLADPRYQKIIHQKR